MSTPTIREARGGDLDTVNALALTAIGVPHSQTAHVETATDRIVLVAEQDGEITGMASVGQPVATNPALVVDGDQEALHEAPWWKLHTIATSTPRAGTGTALLEEIARRLPSGHQGLYGNVDTDRIEAVEFYRSRGFFLAPHTDLDDGRLSGVHLIETPGELYFKATRHHLLKPRGSWEARYADRLLRDHIRRMRKRLRPDIGYRKWLRELNVGSSCGHDRLSPRSMLTFGCDPQNRTWCASCDIGAIEAMAAGGEINDDESICDNCCNQDPDTQVGMVVDEDRRLFGSVYLCTSCREDG